jgi:hypothetical protein
VGQDITTGMTEEQAAKVSRADRPFFVFIHDADAEVGTEDDKAFQDERIAIGARFFDCVRISKGDAAEDRLLKPYADKAPILVFVRPNYEIVTTHQARFNASKMFDAMCATMKKDYKNCVQTVVKKQRDIQKERASLDRDRDKLARLEEDGADSPKAVKLRAEIEASESELATKEGALYQLEPKEDEKVS